MTPYVCLQERIITWLYNLEEFHPEKFKAFLELLRGGVQQHSSDWAVSLRMLGVNIPMYEAWYEEIDFPSLILEQIDSGNNAILNVLGTKFATTYPALATENYGFHEWVRRRGRGENFLRTSHVAQPRALVEGDVLATGERVLCEPREGGNGIVLIKLSSGKKHAVWLELPSRIAVGLLPCWENIPDGLIE